MHTRAGAPQSPKKHGLSHRFAAFTRKTRALVEEHPEKTETSSVFW
jgi:hypothetical protein